MGVVYKCAPDLDRSHHRAEDAQPQMAGDPKWVQRFYNEAKACSRLQHPNTIRMFDFGQTSDGRLFMTMEFLDGMSLRDALPEGTARTAARGQDPDPVLRVARRGALDRHHPPRHQARQRVPAEHGGLAGLREAARLLGRQAARGRSHEDAGRRRVRHAAVHVARAGPRAAARRAQRPLRARHPRVRDAHRQRPVPRRQPDDRDPDAPARAGAADAGHGPVLGAGRSCGARSRRTPDAATSPPAR